MRRPFLIAWLALTLLWLVPCLYALDAKPGKAANLLNEAKKELAVVKKGKKTAWFDRLVLEEAGRYRVNVRYIFTVKDPGAIAALTLVKPPDIDLWTVNGKKVPVPVPGLLHQTIPANPPAVLKIGRRTLLASTWTLNGQAVPVPLEGMVYKAIPGIPPSLLKQGKNVLLGSCTIRVTKKEPEQPAKKKGARESAEAKLKMVELDTQLLSLGENDLAFQTGPILGYAGRTFFTVTCRTNMLALVLLKADGRTLVSGPGLMHAFRLDGLKPGAAYSYSLIAKLPGMKREVKTGPFSTRTFPVGDKLTVAMLGDAQVVDPHRNGWEKVAAAVLKAKPNLTIFTGDMTNRGRIDHMWDESFLSLAPDFFATIPFYVIPGNHEQYAFGWGRRKCPLFTRIFRMPDNKENWYQQIGPALFIGIDSLQDWTPKSKTGQWLEAVLAAAKAKFIFLLTHVPPTSTLPSFRKNHFPHDSRMAEEFIMPLLARYKATAMITGHQHLYQRFEWKGGVTLIVNGGAGGRRGTWQWKKGEEHPALKIAVRGKLHYALLSIDGDTCTMKVVTPDGEVIDRRIWKARDNRHYNARK